MPSSLIFTDTGVAPRTLAINYAEIITLFVFGKPIACQVCVKSKRLQRLVPEGNQFSRDMGSKYLDYSIVGWIDGWQCFP